MWAAAPAEIHNLHEILNMNKTQSDNAFQQAVRMQKQGKAVEAERIFRDILRSNPQNHEVRVLMASTLLAQGRAEEALRQAEEVCKQNPYNMEAVSTRGEALLALDRIEEATAAFNSQLSISSKSPLPHYHLGRLKVKIKDFDAAISHFRDALKVHNEFIPALVELGLTYMQMYDKQAAAAIFEQVLDIDPENPMAFAQLGNCLFAMGRINEALENYDLALDFEPAFLPALKGRANLFLAVGDTDAAQEDVDLAIELSPESADLFVLRGHVCHDLEWNTEAIDAYKKALALNPNLPAVKELIAKLSAAHIPLWHYTMLADHGRNSAYRAAIEKAVRPGMHVLDIGTGTGLLSMMAVRAGAEHVTAVEAGREMSAVAKRVVELNGFADKINVMRIHSFRLNIGQQVPRPVDLIVSEIVDAGLLGEGVLPSLRHAWSCLAAKNAIMLPAGASVEGMLAALPIKSLANVEGFDLSELSVHNYPSGMRNIKMDTDVFEPLSGSFQITNFDFAAIPDEIGDDDPIWWEREISATAAGEVNVVLIWFILHLDSEISVSSGPEGTMDHWGQMAYFLPKSLLVEAGQVLKLRIGRSDKRWWFELSA
jgi:tetratricopeptide (TPR) repeat protein